MAVGAPPVPAIPHVVVVVAGVVAVVVGVAVVFGAAFLCTVLVVDNDNGVDVVGMAAGTPGPEAAAEMVT